MSSTSNTFNAALIQNNTAVNVIYITQTAMDDFIQRGMELIDVEPLGIQIGDYRRNGQWYRNLDGQEVALPVPEDTGPSYADLLAYYEAMKEAVE